MDQLVEGQVALIREQPELDAVAEEVILRLKTAYSLSDKYIFPHDSLNDSFNDSRAIELYIKAVKQKGFDGSVINKEGKADLDRTILLAGRTACEEIGRYGYEKALEQKLNEFSSDTNIRSVYSSAYEYLCASASKP
jgi:hypothetical protein